MPNINSIKPKNAKKAYNPITKPSFISILHRRYSNNVVAMITIEVKNKLNKG